MNRTAAGRRPPWEELLLAYGLVGVLTSAYVAYHLSTHLPADLASGSAQLLQGRTHWITFQNRLLGPVCVELIRLATGWPWLRAFYALVAVCQFAAGAVFVQRAWHRGERPLAGLGMACGWFLLAVIFNHGWSYPWDFTGALLNLLLLIWVADHYHEPADLLSWPSVALLTASALNRESSLIALLSLTMLVGARALCGSRRKLLASLGALTTAAVVNVVFVVGLRRWLFVESTQPATLGQSNETVVGNFLQLRDNLDILLGERPPVRLLLLAIIAGLALLLLAAAHRCWRDWSRPGGPPPALVFSFVYLAVATAAIAVFACVSEFRVFYELIPVCLLLTEALGARPGAAT